ncbi:MAG: UvrD-helicase domain-containing protein [Xanthomonadales bacterium]|jgi:exodeoxyribonuclease V beta subunit|nr:UvrD-helicase domain-containing protein [Xanthomonadales bacterium]
MTRPVWLALPLSGRALVEASAGTGKTWTLAQLYLRLVLERGLQPPQIVVCTFTDAAAGELRGRIRERLQEAAVVLAGDAAMLAGEPEVRDWLIGLKDRAGARRRLAEALATVDLAPISTIHSYCQRVLRDHPFDTGGSFRPGELVDEGSLLTDVVRDGWRRRYLGSDAVDAWELAWVLPRGPEALAAHVRGMLDPGTVIDPQPALAAARTAWAALRTMQSMLKAAADNVGLYASSRSAVRTRLERLAQSLDSGLPDPALCKDALAHLDAEKLATAAKGKRPLILPFVAELRGRLQPLSIADQLCRAAVACETLDELRRALQAQLTARGQLTFRQLIEAVHARITDPRHGPALAAALAERHPVALIDEFQDTDAQQWAIFERIYPASGERLLLLIGDPKQAIYRFRGGDIQTYLQAKDSVAELRHYTIARNFRSHPTLLAGLNRLYAAAGAAAFVDPRIGYTPVSAGDPAKWAGRPAGVLQLRLLAPPEAFNPAKPSVGPLDAALWPAVAADIARLIETGTPPGDIAVLLDSNGRLGALRRALLRARIPVAGSGKRSVLSETIAEELALLLHSLLHPGADRPLRGALATRLLGHDAASLLALETDSAAWQALLERQQLWRERWFRHGVLALLDAVLEARGPALRGETDGERLLTDLRHLGELLAAMEPDSVGPEALYARFQSERDDSGGEVAGGERQLRIESDASRVQLMTLHAAKGLEFPVVLLPTVWRRISFRKRIPDVTQFASSAGRCYDPGGPDFERHWAREREELAAERLRLLYVGLTRAQQRCVVYGWQLPLASLCARADLDDDAPLTQLLKAAAGRDSADWTAALGDRLIGTLTLTPPDRPVVDEAPTVVAPVESGAIPAVRAPLPAPRTLEGRYSFTSLSRRMDAAEASRPAEDEVGADLGARLPEATEEPLPRLVALAALKGPAFGDSVHALLEATLLGEPIDPAAQLAAAGLLSGDATRDAEAAAAVGALVEATLHSELAPGLTLAGLSPRAKRPEFGFAFALGGATPTALRALLAEHGLAELWPVTDAERALGGLMVGAIDLVYEWQGRFHVLDYKTNWLGERAADYRPQALEPAMRAHHYPLQALIYTVALHRYLSRRMLRVDAGGEIHSDYDPERHLGEAWYLFVRGLGTGPDHGLWRRRFPVALIRDLDACLDGELLAEAA